jgi:hypothetical protein
MEVLMPPNETTVQIKTTIRFDKDTTSVFFAIAQELAKLHPGEAIRIDTIGLVKAVVDYRRRSNEEIHSSHPTMLYNFDNIVVNIVFDVIRPNCDVFCQWVLLTNDKRPLLRAEKKEKVTSFRLYSDN